MKPETFTSLMSTPESYNTIGQASSAEYKDRGSKFIANAFPVSSVDDFKKRLDEVKKNHPKATHHCFAYRIGADKNLFRVSDDGEPSGTAGKPILGQIDSKDLTDTLVIVTRYFGGSLLGVPGLINAYKMAASMALQVTPVIRKDIEVSYKLYFDYTRMNEVMRVLKQRNVRVIAQEMQLFCEMTIAIPLKSTEITLNDLNEMKGVEAKRMQAAGV
jgi:uncharacterized YigZ family protein